MHFATIWEAVSDAVGDHTALVQGDLRRSWSDYEARSARLAGALTEHGLGPDSKVAIFLYNSPEYAESQFAALKLRGVPVNVNYRYRDDELAYLLDDSDAEAVVFHGALADRVARVKDRCPAVKAWIHVDDGEGDPVEGALAYEDLCTGADPMPRISRQPSDVYMLYTGGTTGMPKGVMYELGSFTEQFVTQMPMFLQIPPVEDLDRIAEVTADVVAAGNALVSSTAAPLMHGTGAWLGLMAPHLFGGTCVLFDSRSLDPDLIFSTIAAEGVNLSVIVGDAFARPMLRALDDAAERGEPHDLSSFRLLISSGAMFSHDVKMALIDRHAEHLVIVDALGSTEGAMGTSITMKGLPPSTAKFAAQPTTKVFDDDDAEVEAGSGQIGWVATSGAIPFGYYKDEQKSARTFREIGGVRYSFPGDQATVDADGTLVLLGRGSNCINTGGEKVWPEEVEEAVKSADDAVEDCLIFGVDDERFGQRVVGVFSTVPGRDVDAEHLVAAARDRLAAFKAPRQLVRVERVPRTPSAKADYPAAKERFLASV